MRERLVLAFVGLTLAVIGLYGVPRAYYLADLVRDHEWETVDTSASQMAALVEERQAAGGEVDRTLLQNGLLRVDRVEHVAPDGDSIAVGGVTDGEGSIVESRSLPDGGTVSVSISADRVDRDVQEAITPLVLIGLVLAALSALLGWVLARRMSRPFQELAESARDLGHGRFDIDVPSYSVPEAEAIGASLRGAAGQLDDLVRREREFATNASHQLRTPITALRLSLEDLSLWPETAPEVREELEHGLGELDRLSTAIDELLDLARGRRLEAQQDVDLAELVGATTQRWRRRLEDSGRELVVQADGPVPARVPTGPVTQVLDALIDNARVHGRGTVTVQTRRAGTHLEVAVLDEGRASLRPDVFQRGVTSRPGEGAFLGIGLAVASELAELCGGHLSIDAESPTTRLVLWLPLRDDRVSA